MTPEIIKELDSIQDYLNTTPSQDPQEIMERLATVAVYNSRLGELMPEAKRILRTSKHTEVIAQVVKVARECFLSAKGQNAIIDNMCADENFVVDRIERLSRSCVHDIEAQRSILSYLKQELNNAALQQG